MKKYDPAFPGVGLKHDPAFPGIGATHDPAFPGVGVKPDPAFPGLVQHTSSGISSVPGMGYDPLKRTLSFDRAPGQSIEINRGGSTLFSRQGQSVPQQPSPGFTPMFSFKPQMSYKPQMNYTPETNFKPQTSFKPTFSATRGPVDFTTAINETQRVDMENQLRFEEEEERRKKLLYRLSRMDNPAYDLDRRLG